MGRGFYETHRFRWPHIICNLLLLIPAGFYFGGAIYALVSGHLTTDTEAIVSLVLAILVFGTIALGVVSGCLEVKCCVITFIVLMILACIYTIAYLGVAGYGYAKSDEVTKSYLDRTPMDYKQENQKFQITKYWNDLQVDYKCCGTGGAEPWKAWMKNPRYKDGMSVPWSCCKDGKSPNDCPVKDVKTVDCYNGAYERTRQILLALMIVLGIGLAIMLICVLFAMCYCGELM